MQEFASDDGILFVYELFSVAYCYYRYYFSCFDKEVDLYCFLASNELAEWMLISEVEC